MPRLGPTAIIGLLFTIVVMFSMKGEVEVPVLIGLVYVALWARRFFFKPDGAARKLGQPVTG